MNNSSSSNLWLFLEVLAKRRGLIFGLVILATLISVVAALLLPQWFEASALLLPPKEVTVPVGGLSQLNQVVSVVEGLNLPVMVTHSDIYARMLASRTVSEPIIDSFDLMARYETTSRYEAYIA